MIPETPCSFGMASRGCAYGRGCQPDVLETAPRYGRDTPGKAAGVERRCAWVPPKACWQEEFVTQLEHERATWHRPTAATWHTPADDAGCHVAAHELLNQTVTLWSHGTDAQNGTRPGAPPRGTTGEAFPGESSRRHDQSRRALSRAVVRLMCGGKADDGGTIPAHAAHALMRRPLLARPRHAAARGTKRDGDGYTADEVRSLSIRLAMAVRARIPPPRAPTATTDARQNGSAAPSTPKRAGIATLLPGDGGDPIGLRCIVQLLGAPPPPRGSRKSSSTKPASKLAAKMSRTG